MWRGSNPGPSPWRGEARWGWTVQTVAVCRAACVLVGPPPRPSPATRLRQVGGRGLEVTGLRRRGVLRHPDGVAQDDSEIGTHPERSGGPPTAAVIPSGARDPGAPEAFRHPGVSGSLLRCGAREGRTQAGRARLIRFPCSAATPCAARSQQAGRVRVRGLRCLVCLLLPSSSSAMLPRPL